MKIPSPSFFALLPPHKAAVEVGALFTNEEQKKLARDVFNTFATHARFFRDVTDTAADCWAQSGSSHCLVLTVFKRRFLSNRTRNRLIKDESL